MRLLLSATLIHVSLLGISDAASSSSGIPWSSGLRNIRTAVGAGEAVPSLLQLPWRKSRPKDIGQWGYVEVRPKAHMFWWLQTKKQEPLKAAGQQTPLIVWLQGGPGASGTGFGQFTEIGPYDTKWQRREHAWTDEAHVLFLDNPVGTGFSYVEDGGKFASNNTEVGRDLLAALEGVLHALPELEGAPITVVCESYGGKMGVALAKEVLLGTGKSRKVNLQGLALGDSWIHPVDYVLAWGPVLSDLSLLDSPSYEMVMEAALDIQSSATKGEWKEASESWARMESLIEKLTDNVNFYNFLQHNVPDVSAVGRELVSRWREPASTEALSSNVTTPATEPGGSMPDSALVRNFEAAKLRHLARYHNGDLADFMNGEVRNSLGDVIPPGVQWGAQSGLVFENLKADFMKHVVADVDTLLNAGLNITVYTGQLDLICCTKGTQMWMKKLKWQQMGDFYAVPRDVMYAPGKHGDKGKTGAFRKKHDNLAMYYIMEAGHMVPSDQPAVAMMMLKEILDL